MAQIREVLAPAGSVEALYAAVKSGADAVYLGSKAFNARKNASNFTEDELESAIRYCHSRNVKVYIALNTLIGNSELSKACEEIECACRLSADALILQDIGLARLAKKIAPDMPLHASTQMSVQCAEGVKLLEKEGFSRVVLARELSAKEIAEIASQTQAELEVFVHGALCMSVSGQCLMSAMLGSRSGNRGLCAQPCRLPFSADSSRGHDLSLKDLSVVSKLNELADIGVSSFKIEGRMKRPEYVAAAVTACRKSLEGDLSQELCEQLRAVFSRSGFTDGYYTGKLGKEMFGIRQKEDVTDAAGVLKSLKRLYDKESPKIPVDFALTCVEGEALSLSAVAMGKSVFAQGEVYPEKAEHKALDEQSLAERISKCGGTQFYANDVYVELDEGLNAPAGAFNALRRQCLEELDKKLADSPAKGFSPVRITTCAHAAKQPALHLRFFKEEQIFDNLSGVERVILPLDCHADTVARIKNKGIEVAVELPRAFFSNSARFENLLLEAFKNGADLAIASTVDGLGLCKRLSLPVSTGFGMNVFNSQALEMLEESGVRDALVSCELTLAQIRSLGGRLPRGILAYGYIPLMLTRNCPIKNKLNCAQCGSGSFLTDRMGVKFPVRCSFGCSEILNSLPVYLGDRLREVEGADYRLLYFTCETAGECEKVTSGFKAGAPFDGKYTRGLYYRGVE